MNRLRIFTKGPSDVIDHATSEIALGRKLGIDATEKLPGEGFKRSRSPLIKMDKGVKKVEKLFNPQQCGLVKAQSVRVKATLRWQNHS